MANVQKSAEPLHIPAPFELPRPRAIFVQAIGEQIDSAPDFAVKRAVIKS
jgi:hypothetical protein